MDKETKETLDKVLTFILEWMEVQNDALEEIMEVLAQEEEKETP